MRKLLLQVIIGTLVAVLVLLHVASFLCTGIPMGDVKLRYKGIEAALTEEDASTLRELFRFKLYDRGIGGCPFQKDTSISFGNTVFAIALDDCYSAKNMNNGACVVFTSEEFQKIIEIYETYFGDTEID